MHDQVPRLCVSKHTKIQSLKHKQSLSTLLRVTLNSIQEEAQYIKSHLIHRVTQYTEWHSKRDSVTQSLLVHRIIQNTCRGLKRIHYTEGESQAYTLVHTRALTNGTVSFTNPVLDWEKVQTALCVQRILNCAWQSFST